MEIKSALITNSGLDKYSGGGSVSYQLLQTLLAVSDVQLIISGNVYPNNEFEGLRAECANPQAWGYNDENPFSMDYFAYNFFETDPDIDLAVTYACPFNITIEKLKKNSFCKVIADLAPHNINVSREEHMKINGKYPYPHLNNPFLLELYLRHLRLADLVITHSHVSAEYIQKEAKLQEKPTVIPHGTHLPEKTPDFPDDFKIGYFGSLGNDKGFIYLWNAVLKYPSEIKLVIGGKESQWLSINKDYAKRFEPMGFVEDLNDFYKKISVYVHPSVVEGFGITVLEAMAYGRPVIVAEGAGASELVTDGHDGFVIPIRDVKAIQEKIQYFKDNPDEIKRMGKNAMETAKKYTWENIREQYIDEYKKLLNIE